MQRNVQQGSSCETHILPLTCACNFHVQLSFATSATHNTHAHTQHTQTHAYVHTQPLKPVYNKNDGENQMTKKKKKKKQAIPLLRLQNPLQAQH